MQALRSNENVESIVEALPDVRPASDAFQPRSMTEDGLSPAQAYQTEPQTDQATQASQASQNQPKINGVPYDQALDLPAGTDLVMQIEAQGANPTGPPGAVQQEPISTPLGPVHAPVDLLEQLLEPEQVLQGPTPLEAQDPAFVHRSGLEGQQEWSTVASEPEAQQVEHSAVEADQSEPIDALQKQPLKPTNQEKGVQTESQAAAGSPLPAELQPLSELRPDRPQIESAAAEPSIHAKKAKKQQKQNKKRKEGKPKAAKRLVRSGRPPPGSWGEDAMTQETLKQLAAFREWREGMRINAPLRCIRWDSWHVLEWREWS
jgi:hypothetical protein